MALYKVYKDPPNDCYDLQCIPMAPPKLHSSRRLGSNNRHNGWIASHRVSAELTILHQRVLRITSLSTSQTIVCQFGRAFCILSKPLRLSCLVCLTQCMRCGLLLQMSDLAWSVHVCVLRTWRAVQKRLYWSRCRLRGLTRGLWVRGTMY